MCNDVPIVGWGDEHNTMLFQVNYKNKTAIPTFLGITIDKHLNWKEHIDQACNRFNRIVFALKKLRQPV